jgi:hypothetical protein
MNSTAVEKVRGSNAKLEFLLGRTRDALAGRTNFGVEDLRAISEPLRAMEPIVRESARLRGRQPELDGELKSYTSNLQQLQVLLERVHLMLIANLANVQEKRKHLATLGMWVAAWQQTQ